MWLEVYTIFWQTTTVSGITSSFEDKHFDLLVYSDTAAWQLKIVSLVAYVLIGYFEFTLKLIPAKSLRADNIASSMVSEGNRALPPG